MSTLPGVTTGPSHVSLPSTRALHLNRELALGPRPSFLVETEFAHFHGDGSGSLHLALPPELAAESIAQGWAEHHPAVSAGIGFDTLVMLFGPRDDEELATVQGLVKASYDFARGQYTTTATAS